MDGKILMQSIVISPDITKGNIAELTTWRIGGSCDRIIYPASVEDLQFVIKKAKHENKKIAVIGYGSNLLVSDDGFDGYLIVLKKNFSKFYYEDDQTIVVESGFACPRLAQMTSKAGFNNLCFMAGIPGSVGGAVMMNAGAHHQAIMNYVKAVEIIDQQGHLHFYSRAQLNYEYRKTFLPSNGIVLRVWINLEKTGLLSLQYILNYRAETQPLGDWSCGSVFKNPGDGVSAGKLIEDVGLKGFYYKNLQISPKHANFIINKSSASSLEVQELTKLIQQRVYLLTGFWLEPEYQYLKSIW